MARSNKSIDLGSLQTELEIATRTLKAAQRAKLKADFMFQDMKPESAYARLKACCSPTGDQRLTFGQVIRLKPSRKPPRNTNVLGSR